MAEKLLSINYFNGGISSGSKIGLRGSFRWGQGLDIHSDPDRLQIMPKSTKDSGTTVTDLILFGSNNTVNANRYFLGDAGALYKRTSAGSWSKLSTYTDAQGMGFFSGTDKVFFVSGNTEYQLDPSGDTVASGRSLNSADWHPVETFLDKVFLGNGRELISTDASDINLDSDTVGGGIQIEFNFKIKCLRNIGDWLFIGASSDNSSVAKYYIWDGTSSTYNFAYTLKGEDGINSVEVGDDGTVLVSAGKQGHLYQLVNLNTNLKRIKTIPRIEKDKTIETFPGSTENFQGDVLVGLSDGTSLTAERGIYSWASTDKNYPHTLNMNYAISSNTTTGVTLQIGCLLAADTNNLFIGWRDNTTYGVDLISGTGVQSTAIYQSLVHDNGQPFRRKHYKNFKISLSRVLRTGEVITLAYKADGASSWTDIGTLNFSVDGAIQTKRFKPDIKSRELEVQLTFANSGSTAPELDNIAIVFSDEDLI
ncbi:MAG TPA: hypothetical protein ENH85_02805 [Candidatus Scalindua sp.]|nr:hypothetical protein [Candidatus Scalindua sp.]